MSRVASVQMTSGSDVERNLARAAELLAQAAGDGCELAVLPENFALMPVRGRDKAKHAEEPGSGPIQAFLSDTSKALGMWIIAGSIPLATDDPDRVYGASLVIDAEGRTRATYRKIHMFDVDLVESGERYRESNSMLAGAEPVSVDTPAGHLGLTICYDLRFPELYRRLVTRGATWFSVPSAFTTVTGQAHWHVLLRSRAIENLAYVVAAGQAGQHPDRRTTYGHSLIVDPWGVVLAELPDGEGFVAADVEPGFVEKIRRDFPALANRRIPDHG